MVIETLTKIVYERTGEAIEISEQQISVVVGIVSELIAEDPGFLVMLLRNGIERGRGSANHDPSV